MMSLTRSAAIAVAIAAVPVTAAAQSNLDRAYAECRRQLAGIPEVPGTGNSAKEQAIQGCVQDKLRRMQSGQTRPKR